MMAKISACNPYGRKLSVRPSVSATVVSFKEDSIGQTHSQWLTDWLDWQNGSRGEIRVSIVDLVASHVDVGLLSMRSAATGLDSPFIRGSVWEYEFRISNVKIQLKSMQFINQPHQRPISSSVHCWAPHRKSKYLPYALGRRDSIIDCYAEAIQAREVMPARQRSLTVQCRVRVCAQRIVDR